MKTKISARSRLALMMTPWWALAACGGSDPTAVIAAAPSPSPSPSPLTPSPTAVPLPSTAGTPQNLTSNFMGSTTNDHDAVVHSNGNAVIVFTQSTGSGFRNTYATTYQHSTQTWASGQTSIGGRSVSSNCSNPRVVMDSNGNALAVWVQAGVGVRYGRYDASADSWPTIASGTLAGSSGADDLTIACDQANNAVLVWHDGSGLHAQTYSFTSATWSAAQTLTASGNHPAIGMDAQGRAVLAWFRNASGFRIVANRYEPSTGWGTEVELASTFVSDYPVVAVSRSGNAWVCWEGGSSTPMSGDEVWSCPYSINSSAWGAPRIISSIGPGNAGDIAVRMDADNNAVAMWHVAGALYAARNTAGTWAAQTQVHTNGYAPSLVLNDLGQAAAIWQGWSNDVIDSSTQLVATQAWAAASAVQTGADPSSLPKMAISPSGHVILNAWLQQIAGTYHLMTQVVQ